jgi:hypothetical protein
MGAALLGFLRKFLIISGCVGFAYQHILGESPDSVKASLGVTETEGFCKLGIGLILTLAK